MSILLKNEIIRELNAVNWSNEDAQINSDKAFEAIINGIYTYINENYTITGTYVGTHLTPTPSPIFGTTTHSLSITNTSWLNTFKTVVHNGISTGGIQRIFQGIQTFLTGTILATLDSASTFTVLIPPSGTPMVPVVFPSIISFGVPCELEIMGSKPNNKEDVWGIISKYILQGLNLNVVAPMAFCGTIASPGTGITTSILVFS